MLLSKALVVFPGCIIWIAHIEEFKLEQVQRVNGEPGLERTHPVAFLVHQEAKSYCD